MAEASNNPFIKPVNNRAVNGYGMTVMRSGQYIGMGFLESIMACYTNLVYKPISLALIVLLLFVIAAEFNNSAGPLENMLKFLKEIYSNSKEPMIIRNIASLFIIILNFIVVRKVYFVSVVFVWIPYSAKPSNSNMIIALLLSTFTMFGKHSFVEILLLSQCFFLYTELRTPWQKLLFAIIGVTVFLVGTTNVANYMGLQHIPPSDNRYQPINPTTPMNKVKI